MRAPDYKGVAVARGDRLRSRRRFLESASGAARSGP
jgi:hypothetical protein